MRVIHLCFRLHEPFVLRDQMSTDDEADLSLANVFDSKAAFQRENEEVYQPFFALLERNLQKHADLQFSLVVSGPWLTLAERYDPELIRRLKKVLAGSRVELIAEPFYHSLSFFYDKQEFASQVKLFREKARSLLGAECKFCCQPRLMFNNQIAETMEMAHFMGMLASGAEQTLEFRSVNHVYEVVGCDYLRVLFNNEFLQKKLLNNHDLLEGQKQPDGTTRDGISWTKFKRELDLSFLRGGLVNLYFDAGIIGDLRELGVVKFFDEMWADFPKTEGNGFVNAASASTFEVPRMEVSVPETIGYDMGEVEQSSQGKSNKISSNTLVKQDEPARPPRALCDELAERWSRELYLNRKIIYSGESETLTEIWRRLTEIDYLDGLDELKLVKLRAVLTRLKQQVERTKKAQVVEIAREITKKPNMMRVEIVEKTEPQTENVTVAAEEPMVRVMNEEMPDQLHGKLREFGLEIVDEPAKPEKPAKVKKPKKKRRFMRRLVIE